MRILRFLGSTLTSNITIMTRTINKTKAITIILMVAIAAIILTVKTTIILTVNLIVKTTIILTVKIILTANTIVAMKSANTMAMK